jgi:hypothetical protein
MIKKLLKIVIVLVLFIHFKSSQSMNEPLWNALEVAKGATGFEVPSIAKLCDSLGKPCISYGDIKSSCGSVISLFQQPGAFTPTNRTTTWCFLKTIFTKERFINTFNRTDFIIRRRCNFFGKSSLLTLGNGLDELSKTLLSSQTKKHISYITRIIKCCAGIYGMYHFYSAQEKNQNYYCLMSGIFTLDAYYNYPFSSRWLIRDLLTYNH